MIGLARQLAPARLALIANKVSDDRGRSAVEALAAGEGVDVAAMIPHDVRMLEADLAGTALLDFDQQAPSVLAIGALADWLLAETRLVGAAPG